MIDIKLVAQLRERTGAGLADCKTALEETQGNIDAAIEILRKRGEIKAAKKSDRQTSEGVIAIAAGDSKLAVAALSCETDFVARNEDFIAHTQDLAQKLLSMSVDEFRPWAEQYIKDELVLKIGENIQLAQADIIEGAVLGSYIHSTRKIAAVVALDGGDQSLANDIAIHVSALNPKYLAPADIPAEEIAKEKEIYTELLRQENKPEAIWDKIIEGKLAKYYEEVCLLNQLFIKDDSKSITDFLGSVKVVSFRRYQL